MEPSPLGRWQEPQLHLLTGAAPIDRPSPGVAAIGSAVAHAVMIAAALYLPWGPNGSPRTVPVISLDRPRVTPVFTVPRDLTQIAGNKGKAVPEISLEGLMARRQPPAPALAPGKPNPSGPPKPVAPPAASAVPAPKPMEAPKIEGRGPDITELQSRNVPGLGTPQVTPPPVTPPPQIRPEERPKIAFERPGGNTPGTNTGISPGRVPMPGRGTVEEAARQVAKSGNGGMIIGDPRISSGGGLSEALNNPTGPLKNDTNIQTLTETQGVDMSPYLIQILSSVKRNWQAVIPEVARMGRRGKVAIQFAIDRDGTVPKLVISTGSGTPSLDRAAVAGITASNPFPPLPPEFKGGQLRLQMVFAYNTPK